MMVPYGTFSTSLSLSLMIYTFIFFFKRINESSNNGYATPYVYGSYGECVARIDSLAAGMDKGGEQLLDRNDDGMLLVSAVVFCVSWYRWRKRNILMLKNYMH